jgi:hypothetical protein
MRRGTTALLSATLLAALVTACGSDAKDPASADPTGQASSKEPDDANPTKGPTKKPTKKPSGGPTEEQPDGPPFPAATTTQTAESSGEWDLLLSEVRVGDHEGFSRVVLELRGTGTPGWAVGYVDQPAQDASGEVVPLDGDVFLDVYAHGTTYPEDAADYYSGPRRITPDNGGDVAEVYVVGTFEGSTQVLVGIDGGRVPFRVFELADPPRLVVDVDDPGD